MMNENRRPYQSDRGGYDRGDRGDRGADRGDRGQGGEGAKGGRFQKRRFPRRKVCRFCTDKVAYIDFKNYRLLREFLTERGKIIPRRITGTCAKHQRLLTVAIKRARDMALIAFTHR